MSEVYTPEVLTGKQGRPGEEHSSSRLPSIGPFLPSFHIYCTMSMQGYISRCRNKACNYVLVFMERSSILEETERQKINDLKHEHTACLALIGAVQRRIQGVGGSE